LTTITINGSNFDATDTNNIVYLGAIRGKITSASTTRLVVTADTGSTYERITVHNRTLHLTAETDARFLQSFPNSGFDTNLNFKTHVDIGTGGSPFSLVTEDFDNDGKPDIAVLNRSSSTGNVVIFKNNAVPDAILSTSFASVATLGGSLAYPTNIKAADIDGDGRKDIIVSEKSTSRVHIFLNTSSPGSISFSSSVYFPIAPAIGAQLVTAADFDGDGRPDLALTAGIDSRNNDTVVVFQNTSSIGSVSFGSPQFLLSGRYSLGISIGDYNGDGKPDISCTDSVSRTISIFRNTTVSGSGTISFAARDSVVPRTSVVDLMTADVDGDGKQDIVYSCQYVDSIGILRNTTSSG
ncbi:MAG: VCBS repeat-containing protein, partial [Chitinophagia bacterium]|nr:VCBS repeat-containing protein [Chitinophagia bacterium]